MRILKNILVIFVVAVVSLLLLLFLNDKANQKVWLTEYTYEDSKIPSEFDDSKIMVISDLHNADFSENIIKHIKEQMPDYVVMLGDMVQLPDCSIENTVKIANAAVEMNIPIYAISGNHDRQCGEYYEIKDILWANDVYLLENDSVRLEKGGKTINLIGMKDPRHDVVTDEKKGAIRNNINYELSRGDGFSILLIHRADLYPDIKDTGVDLILSGHMHGGIIRLPFLGGLIGQDEEGHILPSYEYGVHKEENSATMITSGGCDKNERKRRVFNPPEVVLITLKGA